MKKLLALLLSLILVMSMFAACDSGRDKDDDDEDDEETTEATKENVNNGDVEPTEKETGSNNAPVGQFDIEGDWTTAIDFASMIGMDIEADIRCTVSFMDGRYTMTMNEDDLNDLADVIIDMIKDMAAEEGSSFEEYTGMTEDDYSANWSESMSETSTDGEYTFDGETLTMDGAENELEIVNNDKIIITESGISMELTRVS